MPRTAKQILKSRGYTDEELGSLAMLTDARFCKALEEEDAERERIASENARLTSDLNATTEWYNTKAVPALNKALTDATTARAEKARLEAQIRAEQEYGMRRVASQDTDTANIDPATGKPRVQAPANPAANDQIDPRYVDQETFTRTADQFGDAIATATDLAEDHRDLFGTRLPGGIAQLRKEYKEAVAAHRFNGDLRSFWAQKFNVETKRTEMAQAAREKEINERINAERVKWQSENLNPMTRTLESSRNPFTRKPASKGDENGRQPWDRGTVEQRRSERVTKFAQKQIAAS